MQWTEKFPKEKQPTLEEIAAYIQNPLWNDFCTAIEALCSTKGRALEPVISYSLCSGAPGWNLKYRKSGRSLCTLYPAEGAFTVLVVIGHREQALAELELTRCTEATQRLYAEADSMNGARWLMLLVDSPALWEDAKRLVCTRCGQTLE